MRKRREVVILIGRRRNVLYIKEVVVRIKRYFFERHEGYIVQYKIPRATVFNQKLQFFWKTKILKKWNAVLFVISV